MGASRPLKLITAILESIFAIPVLGALLIIGSLWTLLGIALVLHIISLVFSAKEKKGTSGNIVGIIASVLGWIPFLGFILHLVSAILLWIDFAKKN